MAWVETESLSFTARHESDDTEDAQRTLDALEDLRLRLEDRFDEAPGGITVVVHPTPGWLAAAHPFLPLARLAAAPAGRRYLAGWAMATELHVLNDDYLDRRAAGEDSRDALRGTAERLYAQIVIAANNDSCRRRGGRAGFCALPALGVAGRGRRAVLRRPGAAVPRRGQHPDAPGQAARPSRPRPATRSSSAARSSTCSSASAAATPARSWSRGCTARAPQRQPRARLRRAARRDRAGLAPLPARRDRRAPRSSDELADAARAASALAGQLRERPRRSPRRRPGAISSPAARRTARSASAPGSGSSWRRARRRRRAARARLGARPRGRGCRAGRRRGSRGRRSRAVRRWTLGMPSSSRIPWISSRLGEVARRTRP